MTSSNSPGHLYINPTSGVQLPSLLKRTISPTTRLTYQSSRLAIGTRPEASNLYTSSVRSRGATLKGFNLSMAATHDDTKRSASFQPRHRSALTTSLANMDMSGYDPMVSGSIATIGLYPLNTSGGGSQTNPLLTDSRMRYSDICDSLKTSGAESSNQVTRNSSPPNDQMTLSQTVNTEEKSYEKITKGTFLTSLETVTAPSLTEAVLMRQDLTTASPPDKNNSLDTKPILTDAVLIPPKYTKKTDFSPPFTMMPRGPIRKMVIDRSRTKSLLDRGLLASHEGLTEEDKRLISGPDIEQHLMSPRASEFIKYMYKRVPDPFEHVKNDTLSPKRLTTTREDNRNISPSSNFKRHLYQDVCGLYSTYPHHAISKQSIRPPMNLMKTLWNRPLTPRTRDKEYIKAATLQPPESHYRYVHRYEEPPTGLTFEEMLKYVPQNEIEYNIFNVYRWRPIWYDLKGWGDPHPSPSIADVTIDNVTSTEQQLGQQDTVKN